MVYLICKGSPWQELGCLSWLLSNCRIFEWWQIGPASKSSCLKLWGPLRSSLKKGLSLGVCFVCLGFIFVFSTYWLRIPYMCLGLNGVESTFIFGSSHLKLPAALWGKMSQGLKLLFTDEETNTQSSMVFQIRKLVTGITTTKFFSSLPLGELTIQRERQSDIPNTTDTCMPGT